MSNNDVFHRAMALTDKIKAEGPDSLTPEELAEFQAIAEAIVETLKPVVAALKELGEKLVKWWNDWWQSLPEETRTALVALGAQKDGRSGANPAFQVEFLSPPALKAPSADIPENGAFPGQNKHGMGLANILDVKTIMDTEFRPGISQTIMSSTPADPKGSVERQLKASLDQRRMTRYSK